MSETDNLNITIDGSELYREEVFTDRKMGTIRVMIPVTRDGSDDGSREVLYIGSAQLMTPMGALPIAFELEAKTLDQAIDLFPDAAKRALEQTMEEIKEFRRQQASSIVMPDSAGGLGGMPGGGIHIP